MKELLEYLVKAICQDQDQIQIDLSGDENFTQIKLLVSTTDIGRIIGKQGRTIQSIRLLLGAAFYIWRASKRR